MSYKQKALALSNQLGAEHVEPLQETSGDYWEVEFYAPTGMRWIETNEHGTWTREFTLTECWKHAYQIMTRGLEPCDCADCN